MLLNHCRQWSRYTNHSTMQFVQEHYHNYEEKIKKIDIVDRKKDMTHSRLPQELSKTSLDATRNFRQEYIATY